MLIKEFCNKYKNIANDKAKQMFIKDNLEVLSYLPFKNKLRILDKVVQPTVFKFEDYTTDTGEIKQRSSGQVKVDSISRQILFYRFVIENYTNLEVSEDFIEDYDALKQSGLLYELFFATEEREPLIPASELVELNHMIEMKVDDTLTNSYEIHGYISGQVERLGKLANLTINPILEKLADEIGNLDEDKINQLSDIVKTTNNQKNSMSMFLNKMMKG
jgi:hypothetical protein